MSSDPYSVSRNHISGVTASAGHSWLIVWSLDEERGLYYMLQHITLSWVLIQSQYFCSVMLGALDLSLVEFISLRKISDSCKEQSINFFFFFFYWKIIALQYCVGLCHTSTCISHRYTYVPSLWDPPAPSPISSYLSRLSQSSGLSFLCHTENSHLLSILHMVMCMFPRYSRNSFHLLLPLPTEIG